MLVICGRLSTQLLARKRTKQSLRQCELAKVYLQPLIYNLTPAHGFTYIDDMSRSLFQRALAELKFLGLLKSSRKKSDHVAKMMWKGL